MNFYGKFLWQDMMLVLTTRLKYYVLSSKRERVLAYL
jgi:hypothetical protein